MNAAAHSDAWMHPIGIWERRFSRPAAGNARYGGDGLIAVPSADRLSSAVARSGQDQQSYAGRGP
eukprot:scaffold14464_cov38-Prasinocladus_malaysianus.AAC.1